MAKTLLSLIFLLSLTQNVLASDKAFTVLLSYLTLGALGLPIFALGKWGIYGPSFGYLLGMLICSVVVGYFSDSGYAKTFSHVFILSGLGTFIIYFFGLIGLTFYVKKTNLLSIGVYPFLIGDLLKIIVISLSVKKISAFYQKIKI